MTKESKADHKQWRDEFELTGENPIAWQLQARSHLAAANVLLERVRTLGMRGKGAPSAEHEPPRLRMMPVYLLLGYALENLVKGLLVARGETATWPGSFEEDRSPSLDKGLKHHCLTDLFRVASVKTNADEKRVRENLRDAIESEKYPVGVRPRSRKRTLGADSDRDIEIVCALFCRLELSLRQICLDLVLSPCEPATLGMPKR